MVSTVMNFSIKIISGIELTKLTKSFREQVEVLDQKLMGYHWTKAQWEELWESPSNYCLALIEKDGLKGFSLWMHSDHWELLKITVRPELRGSGISQNFFNETVKAIKAEKVFLEVSVRNAAAISFYEKLGFKQLNRVKGYYRDGSDALKLVLTIDFLHNN